MAICIWLVLAYFALCIPNGLTAAADDTQLFSPRTIKQLRHSLCVIKAHYLSVNLFATGLGERIAMVRFFNDDCNGVPFQLKTTVEVSVSNIALFLVFFFINFYLINFLNIRSRLGLQLRNVRRWSRVSAIRESEESNLSGYIRAGKQQRWGFQCSNI